MNPENVPSQDSQQQVVKPTPPSNVQPQQLPIISNPVQQTTEQRSRTGAMHKFCRISKRLTLPMAFILPLWLTFGAAGGWLTLLFIFILSPVLFVILLVFHFLVNGRADVVANKKLSPIDAVTLTVLYISIFAYGFFVVNGGDTTNSINSDAMKLFGRGFENTSQQLSNVFLGFSIVLVVLAFVLFLYERLRKPIT